ncbi:MAG: hypothetical protein RLT05_21250, partial [Bauldia litoralis]
MLEAGLVYSVMGLMRLVPLPVASAVGGFAGRTLGPLLPVNKRARRNITRALPDASRTEQQRILRGMWDNLGRVVGESVHIRHLWDPDLNEAVHKICLERLFAARERGEDMTVKSGNIEIRGVQNFLDFQVAEGPLIIFTAHMGNWELL